MWRCFYLCLQLALATLDFLYLKEQVDIFKINFHLDNKLQFTLPELTHPPTYTRYLWSSLVASLVSLICPYFGSITSHGQYYCNDDDATSIDAMQRTRSSICLPHNIHIIPCLSALICLTWPSRKLMTSTAVDFSHTPRRCRIALGIREFICANTFILVVLQRIQTESLVLQNWSYHLMIPFIHNTPGTCDHNLLYYLLVDLESRDEKISAMGWFFCYSSMQYLTRIGS